MRIHRSMKIQIRLVHLFLLAVASVTTAAENTFAYRAGLIGQAPA